MKKFQTKSALVFFVALMASLPILPMLLLAQQDVNVNGHDVGSWFERNWMWVVGAFIFLLILAVAGRGGNRRKTTTVIKDDLGNVKSVSTTEVKE